MAGFRLDVFKGIRPRVSPRLLPVGEAQTCVNTRFGSGSLEPWNGIEIVEPTCASHIDTLHRMRNGGDPLWLQWTSDVDVARGPVPEDDLERTYYTGESEPRMTYLGIVEGSGCLPDDYRVLGVPAPTGAPSVLGDALPDTSVSGSMTIGSWATNYMNADFVIEDNLPDNAHNNYWQMSDGGGYESTGVTREYAMDFYVGQEIEVTDVVDANNVRLADANGQPYLAKTVQQARATGGLLHFRTDDSGTTRDGYFRFYVPNDIKVTLPAHNLQVGDIIRISSIGATVTLVLEQFSGSGTFYGEESDHPSAPAAIKTWAAAPVSVAADDFWIAGARAYPFEEVWVDTSGAGSASSFNIEGGFSWELHMRDGVLYEDIATDIESRAYVYTFVTNLGEEGAPSPASAVVTIPTDGEVVVGDFDAVPTVVSDQIEVTAIRIYRTNTGSGSTEFQFVAEIASPYSDYTDSLTDSELGEVLQSEDWDMPSEDMIGITALPNGIMAGFFGKTLCFSEPYYPHAWPTKYRQAVDHEIVGLGVLPNGVAVLTTGSAYIAVGDHPAATSLRHLAKSQSCVSKRSTVSTMNSVIYASPDGLASIGAGGFQLITENHVTKREWQESFDPTSIRGFWHDQKYIGFNIGLGLDGGFIFDPEDESVGLSTTDVEIKAGYLDAEEDTLYVITPNPLLPMIVATADSGTNNQRAMSSPTATLGSWTTRTPAGSGSDELWRSGRFIEPLERWFFFGEDGSLIATNKALMYTDDGTAFHTVVPDLVKVHGIAWSGGETLVACGTNGGSMAYSISADGGLTWGAAQEHSQSSAAIAIEWIGDRYISLNDSGYIQTSPSGLGASAINNTWTTVRSPGAGSPSGAVYRAKFLYLEDRDRVVLIGDKIYYSDDKGVSWTEAVNDSNAEDIAYSPEQDKLTVVLVGAPYIRVSYDGGTTWSTETPPAAQQISGITWSSGLSLWIAVCRAGTDRVFTSPGNGTWSAHAASDDSKQWEAVVSGGTSGVGDISKWDTDQDAPMTYTWHSGRTPCPYPLNLSCVRIEAEAYPVTFKLYNDRGNLVTTRTVTSSEVIRLPGGYLTSWFEIEVTGSKVVRMVHVAETVRELLQG